MSEILCDLRGNCFGNFGRTIAGREFWASMKVDGLLSDLFRFARLDH